MNGAHDIGGRHGFGPVTPEVDEPVFHADWEKRVFGISHALGAHALWNLDEDRHAVERQHPAAYLRNTYYENWLAMFDRLLVEKGVIDAAELTSGRSSNGRTVEPLLRPDSVHDAVFAPYSYHRDTGTRPLFAVGQNVRVRNMMTAGHTRLPGYLGGAKGEIAIVHGCHVFPDSNSKGRGEDPRWLYAVRFRAADVWGQPSRDTVHADLWEPYLEPA